MVSGRVYKFKIRKGEEEDTIRIWKTPFKQEATARMGSKEAIFKFSKEGISFQDGERFPAEIEQRIKDVIMQYIYNRRIHK